MKTQPVEMPLHVAADSGLVIIDGPAGIVGSLTPDSAQETARRLVDAAEQARSMDPKA